MIATAVLLTAGKVVATWLVVDFISGVVHWAEDSYGHPAMPFVGRRITRPNLLHHARPRAFVTNSWWTSSQLLVVACAVSLGIAWAVGHLNPLVVLAAVLGVNANEVHKWSHRTAAENGPVITGLQRLRLLQTPQQHHGHHIAGKNSHYCVLTNVLNPILDGSGFWRGLEWVIAKTLGVRKRDDDALLAEILAREPDFLGA